MNLYTPEFVLLLFCFQLILSLLLVKKSKVSRQAFLLIQIFFMSIYFGARDIDYGTDTKNYVIAYLSQDTSVDIGLVLINKVIHAFFGTHYHAYLSFLNLIIISNLAQIINKLIKNKSLINLVLTITLFMPYVFLMNINILRQGLSLSFIILGVLYYLEKSKAIGIFFVVFGSLLHYSMTIFVVILIFYRIMKINSSFAILFIVMFYFLNISGIIDYVILNIPNSYLRNRFFHYMTMKSGYAYLAKVVFYLANFYLFRFFTLKNSTPNNKILLDIFSSILLIALLISKSELSSTRYLIISELFLPVFFFNQIQYVKESKAFIGLVLILFVSYSVFFFYSSSFSINFHL